MITRSDAEKLQDRLRMGETIHTETVGSQIHRSYQFPEGTTGTLTEVILADSKGFTLRVNYGRRDVEYPTDLYIDDLSIKERKKTDTGQPLLL